MSDTFNLDELDPGIRRTVAWLRARGFETTDSGDGKTKTDWIADGEALPYPHVAIRVESEDVAREADRLWDALAAAGVTVGPASMDEASPSIQASYDPGNGIAVILLSGVDDSLLTDRRRSVATER